MEVHQRADKPIQVLEFQNWLESGYTFGTMIWDNYKLACIRHEKSAAAEGLMSLIKQYVLQTQQEGHLQTDSNAEGNSSTLDISTDKTQITISNVVQFAAQQKWRIGSISV